MLYGLYPYVVEQMDGTIETSSCVGVSIRRSGWQWRCKLHIVSTQEVKSAQLALVAGGTGWERRLLNNVVPILACLRNKTHMKTLAVEGDVHVGRALAAVVAPSTPLVIGLVTQETVFVEVQKQFLKKIAGLDPMSVLEYFRVRLMPVTHERFLDKLPTLGRVSIVSFVGAWLMYLCL